MSTLKVTHLQNESNSAPSISISSAVGGGVTFAGISTFHGEVDLGSNSLSGDIIGNVTGNLTGDVTVATGATISGSTNTITASTNGEERLHITSDGKIGVGTEIPDYNLTIGDGSSYVIQNLKSKNDEFGEFRFGDPEGVAQGKITYDHGTDSLRFTTNGDGEKLRISSDGNTLIPGTQATSSETGKLDIYHTSPDDINSPHIRLWGAANNDARIEFGSPVNTGEGGYIMYNDSDEGLYIGSRMATHSDVNICTGMNDGSPTSNKRLTVTGSGDVQVTTGNLVIGTSGKGINFSAYATSGNPSSNLLDDYEEGTFTPVVRGDSSAGTYTPSTHYGKYTKIGRQVFWEIYVTWSAGNGTGNLQVAGLPFTVQTGSGTYPGVSIGYFLNVALSANHQVLGLQASNNTFIYFYQIPSGGGANSQVPYDGAGTIIMSGNYITDS